MGSQGLLQVWNASALSFPPSRRSSERLRWGLLTSTQYTSRSKAWQEATGSAAFSRPWYTSPTMKSTSVETGRAH